MLNTQSLPSAFLGLSSALRPSNLQISMLTIERVAISTHPFRSATNGASTQHGDEVSMLHAQGLSSFHDLPTERGAPFQE